VGASQDTHQQHSHKAGEAHFAEKRVGEKSKKDDESETYGQEGLPLSVNG
jgi:hypothetical protein